MTPSNGTNITRSGDAIERLPTIKGLIVQLSVMRKKLKVDCKAHLLKLHFPYAAFLGVNIGRHILLTFSVHFLVY